MEFPEIEFIQEIEAEWSPRNGTSGWESVLFIIADENDEPATERSRVRERRP